MNNSELKFLLSEIRLTQHSMDRDGEWRRGNKATSPSNSTILPNPFYMRAFYIMRILYLLPNTMENFVVSWDFVDFHGCFNVTFSMLSKFVKLFHFLNFFQA